MSNEQSDAKVIPFPRQLRVVPLEREIDGAPITVTPAAVDHDGRTYDLEALLRQLPHCHLTACTRLRRRHRGLGKSSGTRWCGVGRVRRPR